MIAVIQRVNYANVKVDEKITGSCQKGFLILLGVANGDTQKEADKLAEKTAGLRIFEDENGKMNISIIDIGGEAVVVSNFTLCADCKKGKRPSFVEAAQPNEANELYEYYVNALKKLGIKKVHTGIFGADMKVELLNDGPVTIILDSDKL
jgi:D-tyrosyl-tRNA(Tyr) deacylase